MLQGPGIQIKADIAAMFFADEVVFYGFPLANYGTEEEEGRGVLFLTCSLRRL